MYNHLLNINNNLDIKMLLSDENKQKNTDGQFSFFAVVCFHVFFLFLTEYTGCYTKIRSKPN